jgi:hypothetical protein
MNRTISVFLASLALWALPVCAAHAADEQVRQMHGFRVEYAKVGTKALERMLPSLEKQFEIVEKANVPPAVLEYFKTVPVVIVPDLKTGYGHAGMEGGRQIVELKADRLPSDRPILLHELLHAYHGQKIGRSTMILSSYQEALQSKIYPRNYATAHFLENPREYFAVIASIFLYGKRIEQPPFTCSLTAKHQPEFIAFLAEHFGPRPCK